MFTFRDLPFGAPSERKVCESCETLRQQLAIANIEKRQMLEAILSFNKPSEIKEATPVNYEELKPKMMTWNVRRQMLEAEDRKKAQVLAENKKRDDEIAKLEKELKIGEEVKEDV